MVSECVSQCVLLNARSLKNKLCDLNHLLSDEYFAVSITESWLNSSVTNAMIDVSGRYNVHRNDRLTRQGGGVLCLVNNKWTSFTIPLPEKFQNLDVIAVKITTDIGSLRYITAYRSPEFNQLGREYMVLLVQCLEYLCNTRDTVVLVGDFNLPNVDWISLNSLMITSNQSSLIFVLIMDCISSSRLQLVNITFLIWCFRVIIAVYLNYK